MTDLPCTISFHVIVQPCLAVIYHTVFILYTNFVPIDKAVPSYFFKIFLRETMGKIIELVNILLITI